MSKGCAAETGDDAPTRPGLLLTAKTQRWTPEELLRTLIEAEITARDTSNTRTRMKTAAFPVLKSLDEFDVSVSSIPAATFDYLGSLEWITAAENLCLVGPAGTGKSRLVVALGVAAVQAGHRVRYFTAAELVRDPLPRPCRQLRRQGPRDPAAQRPGHRRRGRLRAPWTTPAPNCYSGSSQPLTNAEPSASPPRTKGGIQLNKR